MLNAMQRHKTWRLLHQLAGNRASHKLLRRAIALACLVVVSAFLLPIAHEFVVAMLAEFCAELGLSTLDGFDKVAEEAAAEIKNEL